MARSSRINFDNINLQQPFSLPNPIMSHIIMKPWAARVYKKLIQTYNYYKNPAVSLNGHRWNDEEELSILRNHISNNDSKDLWYEIKSRYSRGFLQNLNYCNLSDLSVFQQNLTYDEFKMLTKSKTVFSFYMKYITIRYKNGEIVPFEKIMEELPNVVHFRFVESFTAAESAFTPKTFQNLVAPPSFQNLELFRIHAPLGEHDFNFFTDFLRKNDHNRCVFALYIQVLREDWLFNLRASISNLTQLGQPLEFDCKMHIDKILRYTLFTIQRLINGI